VTRLSGGWPMFRGRSSVVEHLLCKQGAVGSIPTVSIGCELVLSWPRGLSEAGRKPGGYSLEGAHVPLHDRFRGPAWIPRRGLSGAAVLFDR
jgi:hypothetical protein